MANKIIEKIIEPSKIVVSSNFLIKIKVKRIQSNKLISEDNCYLITEAEENLITEGDYE